MLFIDAITFPIIKLYKIREFQKYKKEWNLRDLGKWGGWLSFLLGKMDI